MKARFVLMGGLGYPATETAAGMPNLKARLEALGVSVLLTSWKDRQAAYDFMHGFDGFRGYAGDSLGAGSAGQYPGDLKGEVHYAAGFQPSIYDASSIYDARSHDAVQIIAPNIVRAHCIFDPYFIDTAGLGRAQWKITAGSKTRLMVTEHRGAHPDDWGYSQDLIFAEIKGLLHGH